MHLGEEDDGQEVIIVLLDIGEDHDTRLVFGLATGNQLCKLHVVLMELFVRPEGNGRRAR